MDKEFDIIVKLEEIVSTLQGRLKQGCKDKDADDNAWLYLFDDCMVTVEGDFPNQTIRIIPKSQWV